MEPNIDNEISKQLSGTSKRAKRINKVKWVVFKETAVWTNFVLGNRVFWNFHISGYLLETYTDNVDFKNE